ncbi:MAG: M20/M25/M40 family metallo-hydrolase [Chloroflexota bacterium]
MTEQAIADLMDLLPIEGPPAKEANVASTIRQKLVSMGIPDGQITHDHAHTQSEYGGEVGNMIVQIQGRTDQPRLMFSTHMDTVPIAVGCQPRLEREENRIVNDAEGCALGGDNRLGCAVLLHLTRELLKRHGDHPPITLVFFVQEEVGLVGARGLDLSLLGEPVPTMCFNWDGGYAEQFVTAVTGTERFTIDLSGIASHAGSRPADGLSAAVIAAHAIAELDSNGWHGHIDRAEGLGSANVGIVQGGQGSNVVMPDLNILAEARSHSSTFRQQIVARWKEAFTSAAQRLTNQNGQHGSVAFGPGPAYESFALDENEPTVQRLLSAAQACDMDAKLVSNNGGMDANWIVAHGIPAVTIGAGQRDVHKPDEWIDLVDFDRACRLAVAIADSTI